MSSEAPALEWRPGWVVAVATVGIVLAGGFLVFGFMHLAYGYAHPAPWMGQLPNAIVDLPLIVVAASLGVPWVAS